jgi:dsRNA-specific ribonuclease
MSTFIIPKDEDIMRTEEGLVFNPYNPNNVQITLHDVQCILQEYGLPPLVQDFELYRRAFIHRSYTRRPDYENMQQNITIVDKPHDCLPLSKRSNERLEFLGDGILEAIAKFSLYRRFPNADEGFMSDKKIAIVQNSAIGRIALEMGLNKWLILSRNAEENNVRRNLAKLGCLFEAFIGALFLDFNKMTVNDEEKWFQHLFEVGPGFQMAQLFVEKVFEKHVDWTEIVRSDSNFKKNLQVFLQKEFKDTPHYLQFDYDPEKGFRMGVFLCLGQPIHTVHITQSLHFQDYPNFKAIRDYLDQNDGKIFLFLGEGQHKKKGKAEQIACEAAIQNLHLKS